MLFMSKQIEKKCGFSLAEVLITLAIVGIVAALTIPSLMDSSNSSGLSSALKKNYSVIDRAGSLVSADNGGSFQDLCPGDDDYLCLATMFKQYLIVLKDCPVGGTLKNCWHAANKWHDQNGDAQSSDNSDRPNMILSDGSLLSFSTGTSNCYLSDTNYKVTSICSSMFVDVNGFNGPNIIGKDIFRFIFLPNGIVADGSPNIMNAANVGTKAKCEASSAASDWHGSYCTYYFLNIK